MGAKETVSFSIKIAQESADLWRKGLQASIDEGREATLPLDGVVFEGSKLFDVLHKDADLASITIMPMARPAVLKILAPQIEPGGNCCVKLNSCVNPMQVVLRVSSD